MGMLIKTDGAPAASPLPHTYFAGKGTLTRVGLPTPQSKQPVTLLPEKNKAPSVAKTGGAEQSDTTFLQKLNDLVTVNQNMQTANSAMAVGRLFGNKQLESTGKQLGQTAYENYRDAAKEFQYIAERAALGAAKGTEGIVNALGYLGQMQNRAQIQQNAQVLGAWGALTGNSDFKGAAQHMNDYTRELKDAGLQDTVSFGDRYQQNIQHRYADTDITKTGRVLGDVSETLGGLAPAAAMNVAAPGSGIAITALSAGGNAAQEALASGAFDHQALAYGIAVGGVEAATEKMFDGVAGVFGKGTADDVVEGIVKRLAKNERAQAALVKVANSMGEGFEEFVSEFAQRAANEMLIDTDDRTLWETNRDAAYSGLMGLLVSGIIQSAETVGRGGLGTPAQEAQRAAQAAVEQLKGRTAQTEYRATEPQNVELPTVPIVSLSMKDVANLNGGVMPEAGNTVRSTAINRTKNRLGLNETSEVYIPASNVMRNGEEYILKITRSSLNKMLSPSNSGVVAPESIAVLENIERIANNGVYFRSEGDRQGRDQIAGYDHLMTTVYIDNQPYVVDMRVRLVQQTPNSKTENVLYYFTPEEIVTVKKIDADLPTGKRRALTMSQETASTSDTTVPQRVPGVKKQSMQESAAVFAGSSLSRRMAEAETEYNAAIEQARYTGEYELAEALYKEKLRVQDALTEQEIGRLRNELEQYQRQHQAGQIAKTPRQTGSQQLSVGQIGKEYDAAIAQAQQNGEYELADTLYEEKLRAQQAARLQDGARKEPGERLENKDKQEYNNKVVPGESEKEGELQRGPYGIVEFDAHGNPIYAKTKKEANIEAVDYALLKRSREESDTKFGLEPSESRSLANYTQHTFRLLNDRLMNDTLCGSDYSVVDRVVFALKKFPVFQGKTYRNLRFDNQTLYDDFLVKNATGKVVPLKAFTSMSKRPNGYPLFGDYVVHMVITSKSGADIADTYGIPRQQEVILLPGTKIEITSVTTANDGHPLIYAQEVIENALGADYEDGEPARGVKSNREEG